MCFKKLSAIIKGKGEYMFITVQILDNKDEEKTIKMNVAHIAFIVEDFVHMSNAAHFRVVPESMKLLNSIISPKDRIEKTESNELSDLFDELHKLTGGKGHPVFNLGREKKLKFLLDPKKGRMTREQLIQAATNIGKDAFLQGDNESKKRYGDVDYLLRPDKAAKWAEDQQEKKKGMF